MAPARGLTPPQTPASPSSPPHPVRGEGPEASAKDRVVLFDGECRVCAASVRFIRQRDDSAVFRFTPMQSPVGQHMLRAAGLDPDDLTSVVLLEGREAFTQSEAALRIAAHLKGTWRLLSWLRLLPRGLRDRLYRVVARNRHRWSSRRPT